MSVTSLRRLLLVALLACIVVPSSAAASARHDRTESGIIRAINSARASHGLPALSAHRGLARAADSHSASMARTNRVGHGDYGRRVRKYVRSRRVGENIAWMRRCSADAIVRMWMGSSSHRAVILSGSFRRIGVGKRSSSRTCFVTADFATSR